MWAWIGMAHCRAGLWGDGDWPSCGVAGAGPGDTGALKCPRPGQGEETPKTLKPISGFKFL